MIIKNTASRIIGVAINGQAKTPFILKPGVNVLDDKVWEQLWLQKQVQLKIEDGTLVPIGVESEEVDAKGPGGKLEGHKKLVVKSSKNPWKLKAENAVALAKETLDVDLLEKWLSKEARDEVRAAVSNKLDEMKK